VQNFSEDVWANHRFDIVLKGNRAKYMQNSELRKLLLATADRVLVEASAIDRTLGIGLAPLEAMEVAQSEPWRFSPDGSYAADSYIGLNLLGKVLMTVRAELMVQQ